MCHDDGKSVMTLIKENIPSVRLALGALALPIQQSLFCQYHNYPIGTTGKDYAINTRGNKYNITPVRKSFLSDLRAYVCVDGNCELEKMILEGIAGKKPRSYGLPFLIQFSD